MGFGIAIGLPKQLPVSGFGGVGHQKPLALGQHILTVGRSPAAFIDVHLQAALGIQKILPEKAFRSGGGAVFQVVQLSLQLRFGADGSRPAQPHPSGAV